MAFIDISKLRLQYYPTDARICEYFSYLHFPIMNKTEIEFQNYGYMNNEHINKTKQIINDYDEKMKATQEFKFKKDWFKIPSYSTYKFQKDIIESQMNTNDFEFNGDYYSNQIAICDYFCGEGTWLVNNHKYNTRNFPIKTFGIELEQERANVSKANKVDYVYNSAFEDVLLPKDSVSILLFNPPYFNESKDERATKKYLSEILKKEVLIKGESFVDFVIREDDFRDCLDILLDHFAIIQDTIFKAPSDEFSKFKQIVFTARFNSYYKPNLDTRWLQEDRINKAQDITNIINNAEEINLMKVSKETLTNCRDLSYIKFDEKVKSIQLKNNNINKISNKHNTSWNWFKELTSINTESMCDITLPKEPKKGELVNLISSGFLNQQIDNHVVSGGTKQIEETIKSIQLDSEGKERETIEIRKTNQPFFNVLLPTGEIKKLLNKEVN